jgi:hypothetical protein
MGAQGRNAMPTPEHLGKFEMVSDRVGYEDNLRMWGKLYVNRTGLTVGGWLLNSWSELGAPYWTPKMHWFERGEEKFYSVYLDFGHGSINLHGEDTKVEPERAKFMRKMMEKWELEWLQDEGKKT